VTPIEVVTDDYQAPPMYKKPHENVKSFYNIQWATVWRRYEYAVVCPSWCDAMGVSERRAATAILLDLRITVCFDRVSRTIGWLGRQRNAL